MILDVLTRGECEQVRIWRNKCLQTLRTPYPVTKEMQEDFYRDVVCNRKSPHRYYALREKGQFPKLNDLVGMGGMTNIEWENSQAEISLLVNPDWQRRGYGKQAVPLLLDQAFNHLNLDLVYGECYACNPAWKFWTKVAEEYQVHISWLGKGKFWKGTRHDTMYFDVARDDFRKAR